MTLFLTVLHVLVCVVLLITVLLQRGKGAEIGAVFGSGSSTTVFGARGAGTFLTKLTTGAAVVFMMTSLALSYYTTQGASRGLFDEGGEEPAAVEEPLFQELGTVPAEEGAAPSGEGAPPEPAAD